MIDTKRLNYDTYSCIQLNKEIMQKAIEVMALKMFGSCSKSKYERCMIEMEEFVTILENEFISFNNIKNQYKQTYTVDDPSPELYVSLKYALEYVKKALDILKEE